LSERYKIEALLGQGGMSAVYKASDPNLKRVVAIKLIHSHLSSDPAFVTRFEGEAAAVANLRHPNIVQVYDFNNDGGVYYMVLEFIPGETLQDRLKRLDESDRKLSLEEVLKFSLNTSEAIGYAHQRGMIHRDIKPANLMLDVHGQAILMDFGIVKIIGGDSHTTTGAVVGTARYMSPEIIRGEVADHRTDIYSLGVTLYEMLSGRPPFEADSAMTLMMMHLNDPVPDLRSFRPDIPSAIVAILEKCLAKDRDERYGSAAELAADLKGTLALLDAGKLDEPQPAEEKDKVSTIAATKMAGVAEPEPVPAPKARPAESEPLTPPPPPVSGQSPSSSQHPARGPRRMGWLFGAGILGLLCIVGAAAAGGFALSNFSSPAPTETKTSEVVLENTATTAPSDTPVPAQSTEEPTDTPEPTPVPTDTPPPTATYPPLYVRINEITVNNSGQYVVEYETFGYTEELPGRHVHFFFDTVPPEQAGVPGSGPWILYGGPRPFTKYRESDRPGAATQMCALVANRDHSIIMESGNCMDLP
jgi:serine/threonine-protein kinase